MNSFKFRSEVHRFEKLGDNQIIRKVESQKEKEGNEMRRGGVEVR